MPEYKAKCGCTLCILARTDGAKILKMIDELKCEVHSQIGPFEVKLIRGCPPNMIFLTTEKGVSAIKDFVLPDSEGKDE